MSVRTLISLAPSLPLSETAREREREVRERETHKETDAMRTDVVAYATTCIRMSSVLMRTDVCNDMHTLTHACTGGGQ